PSRGGRVLGGSASPRKNAEVRVVEEIVFDEACSIPNTKSAEAPRTLRIPDVASPIANCKSCGCLQAVYTLNCCGSAACEKCLQGMFSVPQREGMGFRCAFCGTLRPASVPA